MRKLGFVVSIEEDKIKHNSIALWDEKASKIIIKQEVKSLQITDYDLLSIIEYDEENNAIKTPENLDFTIEENKELLEIFTIIIKEPHLNEAFLRQLDEIYNPPPKNPKR